MNNQKLEEELDKICNYSIYVVNMDAVNRKVNFEIRDEDYTYVMLSAFAVLFKTTKINVDYEYRTDGYCPSCYSYAGVHIVYVSEIPQEFFEEYE